MDRLQSVLSRKNRRTTQGSRSLSATPITVLLVSVDLLVVEIE